MASEWSDGKLKLLSQLDEALIACLALLENTKVVNNGLTFYSAFEEMPLERFMF